MKRLLIRPGAIGDFLVSVPAVSALLTPESEIWTRESVLPLAQLLAPALSIASTGLDLVGITDTPPALDGRLRDFDEIQSWYGANRQEFRDAVRHLPFVFHPALPPDDGPHACDFYAAHAGLAPGAVPHLPIDAPRHNAAIVHPFASGPRKQWPLENFHAVARALNAEWCAGPEPGAIRFPDLADVARYLAGASVYIGNDSGIAHLAAAVGTPVVVLFGPTNPAVWAPRGQAVQVLSPMSEITPEQVIQAANQIRNP